MDPGRKKIEKREAEFVAVGETIITDEGVIWEVTEARPMVSFTVTRQHGGKTITGFLNLKACDIVKVRNNLTANS